jgi:hypothetical protein
MVIGPVLAAQDEDRHLSARHRVGGAIVPAAAARRDAAAAQLLDRAGKEIAGRHIQKLREPRVFQRHGL